MVNVTPSPFQVGGSLAGSAPSYVTRQADQRLYEALRQSELCYVFNARQMGKSSLRVRTMRRLTAAGVQCVAIDLTAIGIQQVTPEQWYASIAALLVQGFNLPISLGEWWRSRAHLSFIARLQQLIETVLLEKISDPIVIFIDEVDSVLGLNFSAQDFFGLIRHCYDQRSLNPAYQRLSFVLLGVATPADLISDPQATPFNIGQAIELTGFQFVEAMPLMTGLKAHFKQPQQLLQAVLAWTDGQPFLTQKLCDLLCQQRTPLESAATPADWVAQMVRQFLIENWEGQDEPEHFRTIRDRLLHDPIAASQLLLHYQRLLLSPEGRLPLDNSQQQRTLLLSGLLKQQSSFIQVKNPIYEAIFDADWVDQQLGLLALNPTIAPLLQAPSLPPTQLEPQPNPTQPPEPPAALPPPAPKQRWQLTLSFGSLFSLGVGLGWLLQQPRLQTAYQAQAQADLQTATTLASNPITPLAPKLFHALRAYQTAPDHSTQTRSRQLLQTLISQVPDQPNWLQRLSPKAQLTQPPTLHSRLDGSTITLRQRDGRIELWDNSPRLLRRFRPPGQVNHFQFRPQQFQIALAITQSPQQHSLQLWDIAATNNQAQRQIPTPAAIQSIAWSPDGEIIWAISHDQLFQWQADGTALGQWPLPTTQAQTLAIHPTIPLAAIGDSDGHLFLWQSGQILTQRRLRDAAIRRLAFSSDGQSLLSATATQAIRWQTAPLLQTNSDLHQACQYLQDYLKTAPDLRPADRRLCDPWR